MKNTVLRALVLLGPLLCLPVCVPIAQAGEMRPLRVWIYTNNDINEFQLCSSQGPCQTLFENLTEVYCVFTPAGYFIGYDEYFTLWLEQLHDSAQDPDVEPYYGFLYEQADVMCVFGEPANVVYYDFMVSAPAFALGVNHLGDDYLLGREMMIILDPQVDPTGRFYQTYLHKPSGTFYTYAPYMPQESSYQYWKETTGIDEGPDQIDPSVTDNWKRYHKDLDGDGYGDPDTLWLPSAEEAIPEWWVENDGDCDDTNDEIHPGATELCNLYWDDNCNGVIDEGVEPSCEGKECGYDYCGGVCGVCAAGETCQNGQCVMECLGADTPIADNCKGVDWVGCCANNKRVFWCIDGELYCRDCGGGYCSWRDYYGFFDCYGVVEQDPSGQHPYDCTFCEPDCAGKQLVPAGQEPQEPPQPSSPHSFAVQSGVQGTTHWWF